VRLRTVHDRPDSLPDTSEDGKQPKYSTKGREISDYLCDCHILEMASATYTCIVYFTGRDADHTPSSAEVRNE